MASKKTVTIRLTVPQLIGTHHYQKGDVVSINKSRADEIIKAGAAEVVPEGTPITPGPPKKAGAHAIVEGLKEEGRLPRTPEEETALLQVSAEQAGFSSPEEQLASKEREFALFQVEQESKRGGARPGAGRPKSEAELTRVSIYKDVVSRAIFVAAVKGIPIAQYLSEALKPIVDADFARADEELS